MNKILVSLLALLGFTQAVAQDYEYVPFVREGVKWVYYYDSPFETVGDEFIPQGRHYYTLELKGDTVIDGKHYKPMHLYSGDAINEESDTIPVYLREENKVVYALAIDDKRYAECPIGIGEDCLVTYRSVICPIVTGQEYILYDFNDPAEFYENHDVYIALYAGSYMVSIGNRMRKCHGVATNDFIFNGYVIEGIGYAGGDLDGTPLCYFYPFITGLQVSYRLSHVIENGEIIYRPEDLEQLLEPDDYEYVPFVREGVKWVYSVDNPCSEEYSDMYLPIPSGISYYSYEMKGDAVFDGKHYKPVILYYIDSVGIEIVQDIVPVYLREENKVVYAYHPDGRTYLQCPVGYGGSADVVFGWASFFYPMDFFNDGEFILYDFNRPDTFYDNLVDILLQVGDDYMSYLRTDIVKIGKYNCKRHFYKGYDDDSPTNVIIEGIGCDGIGCMPLCYFPIFTTSFEIGYWLSHVIEDGEIIYKGMGYSDDALVGIDEVVADRTRRPADPNYYNLMGQPVSQDVPTAPGIYIHQGKKVVVR